MMMLYEGPQFGFAAWSYDPSRDIKAWTWLLGWGGRNCRVYPQGALRPRYNYEVHLQWLPLAECVEWWAEYLGTDPVRFARGYFTSYGPGGIPTSCCVYRRERRVAIQYRVHSFRESPIKLRFTRARFHLPRAALNKKLARLLGVRRVGPVVYGWP